MKKYQDHELSELFPIMENNEIQKLSYDIKCNGLKESITLLDNKILDGRNRYRACVLAKIEPRYVTYSSSDPLSYVLSLNLHRRHLTESQRAMVAAKIANLEAGKPSESNSANLPNKPISQSEASEKLNVSVRSVGAAKKVLKEGSKKDVKDVESGEKTVTEVLKNNEKKEAAKKPRLDNLNREIPPEIIANWDRAEETGSHLRSLMSKVKCAVEKGIADHDMIFSELHNPDIAPLVATHYTLSQILPYAVCTTCNGQNSKKCRLCLDRGFISKFRFDQCVPSETKNLFKKIKK